MRLASQAEVCPLHYLGTTFVLLETCESEFDEDPEWEVRSPFVDEPVPGGVGLLSARTGAAAMVPRASTSMLVTKNVPQRIVHFIAFFF